MTEFATALNKQNQAELEALAGTGGNVALLRTVATLIDEVAALKARVVTLEEATHMQMHLGQPSNKTHQRGS